MNAKSKGSRRSPRTHKKQSNGCLAPNQPAVWPAYLSAILLWASYPPCSFAWLAWVAPIGWLTFLSGATCGSDSNRGSRLNRKTYFHLWLSGCLFWLSTLQGIRLAYWPLYFGWLALSLYLAIYPPLFVAFSRKLVRGGVSVWLAAPITWTALEFVRSYMLTGFSANMLGHSQVRYPVMTQIADQLGVYGISFVLMLVAATVAEACFGLSRRPTWVLSQGKRQDVAEQTEATPPQAATRIPAVAIASSCVATLATFTYGYMKLAEGDRIYEQRSSAMRCLLVQENTPTMFDAQIQDLREAFGRYLALTEKALVESRDVDLIVWPESTFSAGEPLYQGAIPNRLPQEDIYEPVSYDGSLMRSVADRLAASFRIKCELLLTAGDDEGTPERQSTEGAVTEAQGETYLLVGGDAKEFKANRTASFNTAFFVGPDAQIQGRYDKMHLVMFGEYIPLGPALEWLRQIFRIDASPGESPKSFDVNGTKIAPNICFETMMPRVISRQVRQLSNAGLAPDVLINLSNDSWFRGSAMLDHHLACTRLCAIENRRPILVAANTGLSAEVDGCGRLVQVTDRLEPATIIAAPIRDSRGGLVQRMGYPLGWICLLLMFGAPLANNSLFRRSPE
ncbi:MAG: apolipoprotein N-acyltransferase [Aureliella sp.]